MPSLALDVRTLTVRRIKVANNPYRIKEPRKNAKLTLNDEWPKFSGGYNHVPALMSFRSYRLRSWHRLFIKFSSGAFNLPNLIKTTKILKTNQHHDCSLHCRHTSSHRRGGYIASQRQVKHIILAKTPLPPLTIRGSSMIPCVPMRDVL
jgi:hypothetical protein